MKKLIILIILAITAVSCSLLDNEAYQEMKREESEKGVKCYRTSSGYAYCEDKYGNKAY